MTLPILGESLGNPDQAAEIAIRRGGKLPDQIRRYAKQLWLRGSELGVRADAAFAQADVETGNRATGIGFQSARWVDEGNPAGMGITTDMLDSEPGRRLSPERWADAQIVHLLGYAGIDPGPELRALDFRWQAMVDRGWFGVAETVQDLDERWAKDGPENYGDKIEARWRLYDFPEMDAYTPAGDGTGGSTGGPIMATYKTTIPGLPGGPLETDYPITINLIPTWRANNRPGLKLRGAFDTTQHTTDNYGSIAKGENGYVVAGAEGRQASWHITVDETGAWISLPFDEVGWHASDGSGPGNMSTIACELTMRTALTSNPTQWRRARRIAADIMGRAAARKGGNSSGSYHQTYAPDGKYCPRAIFDTPNGRAEYQSDYAASYADEKRRMAGGRPVTPEPVIGINDIVGTTVTLNFRQAATVAAPVIATLPVGAEVLVTGRAEDAGGYRWLPVRHTLPSGDVQGYVAMAGTDGTPYLTMVTDNADPDPEPVYVPARPIPALLETDLAKYDTAEGITSDDNGNDFIFVADVIEFTKQTVAGEFASASPRPVKRPYKAGERAIAAWLVKTPEGYFYVLAGGDDEWVRVPYANTRRISDAPLLGDEWETTGPAEAAA